MSNFTNIFLSWFELNNEDLVCERVFHKLLKIVPVEKVTFHKVYIKLDKLSQISMFSVSSFFQVLISINFFKFKKSNLVSSYPSKHYLFRVNKRSTRKRCKITIRCKVNNKHIRTTSMNSF